MSHYEIWSIRQRINSMGAWAGVRWLRNQGYSFELAHKIMLNKEPRFS